MYRWCGGKSSSVVEVRCTGSVVGRVVVGWRLDVQVVWWEE